MIKRIIAGIALAILALAAAAQVTTNPTLTGVGVNLTASNVSGTLAVANGGTGVATLTGVPLGSGTSAVTALEYVPWTNVAYAAGNFTGSGAQTWTVESGDQTTFAYTILGKNMTVAFTLITTSVGGTPSINLQITIPASKLSARSAYDTVYISDNATRSIAVAEVGAGGSLIYIQKNDASNFTASTNATVVRGTVTFEIQ